MAKNLDRTVRRVLVWLVLCVASPAASAEHAALGRGILWLIANQDASGLWGTAKNTPFRDATVVVTAVSTVIPGCFSSSISDALGAINSTPTTSVDYLARQILANASANSGIDLAGLANNLAGRQNTDGGWAYSKRYASNLLETALALQALKSAAYANTTVLGAGVSYLTSQQNADHGWAFTAGDTSRVFYTAQALTALAALRGDFNVAPQIQSGTTWLKTQDHGDGGFGTGRTSNAHETALALLTLAKVDSLAPEVAPARAYLEATQRPDGSWGLDAYSTALAVLALPHATPPVSVEEAEEVPKWLFCCASTSPFSRSTLVRYSVPTAGPVSVDIYTAMGRRVRRLFNGEQRRGWHKAVWDGMTDSGNPAASGIYFVRVRAAGEAKTGRLVLLR